MSFASQIEWTDSTWNPITGCTKVSVGCENCYAEKMANRLKSMGHSNYINGFELMIHEDKIEQPLNWKKPQLIFVNSMSDLFHEEVPLEYIIKIFKIMRQANWHQFQILTKRSFRLNEVNKHLIWANNIWMGVTVENEDYLYRINHLRESGAYLKFVSFEPLLGPVLNPNLKGIDWVIVGGESGHHARKMDSSWVTNLRDVCINKNIPFFFKQWGGTNKKKMGRQLDGHIWSQIPLNISSS